jgi:hypothetical protein
MNSKKIVLSVLLIICLTCDPISLTNFIKDKPNTVPPVSNDPEANVTLSQDYIPCGDKDSCGEAKTFGSDKEFSDFVNKYVTPQPVYDMMMVRPIAMESTTAGAALPLISPSFQAAKAPLPSVDPNRDFSGTNNQVNGVD